MGDKQDQQEQRDETIKQQAEQIAELQLSVEAITCERDAIRDQLSVARHTLNPLPSGAIQRPADLDEYKGEYKNLRDGEIYGLKVLPLDEVRSGRTHIAKCHQFSWDGTPEEFRQQFEKL